MTERREVGQVEIHYPFGPRIIPIYEGDWSVDRVLEAHDLWEGEGRQYRVRVLRELGDDPAARIWSCVAHFAPEV